MYFLLNQIREKIYYVFQIIFMFNIDNLKIIRIKIKKAVVTWTSQAVPHLSTNHA